MNNTTKNIVRPVYHSLIPIYTIIHQHIITPIKIIKNRSKKNRSLEIGPGPNRIDGFETINIIAGLNVDYVLDASKPLPFDSESFDIVYASHILEHIPWYMVPQVLQEWCRIIKKGGCIEIFVPDGLKILKTYIEAENGNPGLINQDGWYKFNDAHDPCLWVNGRVFSYGDGKGTRGHPNWHLSLFSERFLKSALLKAGFHNFTPLSKNDVRGYDHGWINLGIRGIKK